MKTFKSFLSEMPHIKISTFIDLELEKFSGEKNLRINQAVTQWIYKNPHMIHDLNDDTSTLYQLIKKHTSHYEDLIDDLTHADLNVLQQTTYQDHNDLSEITHLLNNINQDVANKVIHHFDIIFSKKEFHQRHEKKFISLSQSSVDDLISRLRDIKTDSTGAEIPDGKHPKFIILKDFGEPTWLKIEELMNQKYQHTEKRFNHIQQSFNISH